jgi:hypothetical protein
VFIPLTRLDFFFKVFHVHYLLCIESQNLKLYRSILKSFLVSSLFSLVALPGSWSRLNSRKRYRVEEPHVERRDLSPDIESMFGEENYRQIYDQEVEEARFLELMSKPTSDIVMQYTNALIPVTAMEMFKTALKRFVDAMTLPLFNLLLIRMYRLPVGHGIVSKLT